MQTHPIDAGHHCLRMADETDHHRHVGNGVLPSRLTLVLLWTFTRPDRKPEQRPL